MTSLKDLGISWTPIQNRGRLPALRNATEATRLDFGSTRLASLSGPNNARGSKNYFSSALVTNLEPLRGLTGLETLRLDNTPVNDLTPLNGLKHLECLTLSGTAVTELSGVSELVNLRELDLPNTGGAIWNRCERAGEAGKTGACGNLESRP